MPAPQNTRDLLRFMTCGSVDDGKSTLIGRLLSDTDSLPGDTIATLAEDSKKFGTLDGEIDYALLVDGLESEREQGITIDVAYRYFSTPNRNYIVADTPGHEQYTRNMATGASTASVAVILVNAKQGIVTQTRRHTYIAKLMGVRRFLLAVNKMDLVDWERETFEATADAYRSFVQALGDVDDVSAVPIGARDGDNIVRRADRAAWYDGPTVLEYLEAVPPATQTTGPGFYFPVQAAVRPSADFRGAAGTVYGGTVKVGDNVVVEPGGQTSKIEKIVTYGEELRQAEAGRAVTLCLADERDVGRGSVIRRADSDILVTDQVQAHLIWMSNHQMDPGRQYEIKLATQTARAWVSSLKYKVNVNTLEQSAARKLDLNDLAVCNLSFSRQLVCQPYSDCKELGAFILIDRMTNETVAAGMIDFELRRAQNITFHQMTVDKATRAAALGQRPAVAWFTGLSGAGKSTVANAVEAKLHAMGRATYLLDGDNVRHGLNRDLGFTEADRVENIRRFAEVAKLFTDAGLVVLVSVISPYRSERRMARELMADGEFIEVFVDTPLATCETRDPKGLYAKARRGEIKNFTGIDAPYEAPENPELRLDTSEIDVDTAADRVIELLLRGA